MANYYRKTNPGVSVLTWIFNEGESRLITEDDVSYTPTNNEHSESQVSQGSGVSQLSTSVGEEYFNDFTDWINAIPGSRPPSKPPA